MLRQRAKHQIPDQTLLIPERAESVGNVKTVQELSERVAENEACVLVFGMGDVGALQEYIIIKMEEQGKWDLLTKNLCSFQMSFRTRGSRKLEYSRGSDSH
jgi:hypothetical protein